LKTGAASRWLVIVNPNAGRQKGKHDWLTIASILAKNNIDYVSVFTKHRDHASKLAKKYIEDGYHQIIVVGGDGTYNEVVNGIFSQNHIPTTAVTLAMIPVGTGNDWCRTFNVSTRYEEAIATISRQKEFLQDAGKLKYVDSNGRTRERYFINMAGMGFDALVAKKTNIQKEAGKGNALSYFINIFSSLFLNKTSRVSITLDDRELNPSVFSMSVGICQYNGGGMRQAPLASPDDGLFDITYIQPISKLKIIRSILKLLDGSYIELPEVSTFKSAYIRIESDSKVFIETDGESLGHTPFEFEIVPRSIRVIIGN
jgi:diacylglycerol kinase (ATP)